MFRMVDGKRARKDQEIDSEQFPFDLTLKNENCITVFIIEQELLCSIVIVFGDLQINYYYFN